MIFTLNYLKYFFEHGGAVEKVFFIAFFSREIIIMSLVLYEYIHFIATMMKNNGNRLYVIYNLP